MKITKLVAASEDGQLLTFRMDEPEWEGETQRQRRKAMLDIFSQKAQRGNLGNVRSPDRNLLEVSGGYLTKDLVPELNRLLADAERKFELDEEAQEARRVSHLESMAERLGVEIEL